MKFFKPADELTGDFKTATYLLEYISEYSSIKINPVQIGKELKFLGYMRKAKFIDGNAKYGYLVEFYKKQ
jgi:hypothetical protein